MSEKKPRKAPAAFLEAAKTSGFKPGNQLAKGKGRPPMTAEQKALAVGSRTDVKNIMTKYLTYTIEEVEDALENKELAVLDIAVLRNLKHMHTCGDLERMDWMMDHVLGKQAAKVEVKNTSSVDLNKLSIEELNNLKAIAAKSEGNK